LAIDVDALRRTADAFFSRLHALAEDWQGTLPAAKWAPWLGVVSVVAYECARLRKDKTRLALEDGWDLSRAFLPEGDEA
jgi:hypothetical protein